MLALMSALALAGLVSAQVPGSAATADQLAAVVGAYDNSGFNTPIGNSLAFNIPLQASALMTVTYGSVTVSNGQALTAAQVAAEPAIDITPSAAAASSYAAGTLFTIMLADAAAIGNPDAQGYYRHYLANSAPATAAASTTNVTFPLGLGNVITPYAGPGPNAGEGPHRYAWLLFAQPSTFTAPAGLNTPNTAPGHWNITQYVQQAGLGSLVAASFFTVQNGAATYTVPSTTPFVAASTAAPATTTAALSGSSSRASFGAAAPSSSTSTTGSAAAIRLPSANAAGALVVLVGLALGFVVVA